jgi:hypothetical protein
VQFSDVTAMELAALRRENETDLKEYSGQRRDRLTKLVQLMVVDRNDVTLGSNINFNYFQFSL